MTLATKQQAQRGQQDAQPLRVPADPNREFLLQLEQTFQQTSRMGVLGLQQGLPAREADQIVRKAMALLKAEPTLVEVQPGTSQLPVIVVGDTHGQYHDLCRIFELKGHPSQDRIFIFNGDYVDRGAWGVETLLLLLAWKWLLPTNVYLLRGNHEGAFCTKYYGFMQEVAAKYGSDGKSLYQDIIKLFACLPLAALVEGSTLILHGGLFRAYHAPARRGRAQHSAPRTINDVDEDALRLGTLEDLKAAGKGGVDPDPEHSLKQLIASDVVWSDPSPNNGFKPNVLRGVGNVFGPDATERFCQENQLQLIIRSHEGPDARHKRAADEKMPSIHSGYSVDHAGQGWKLVTLFSAPDYPMFMAEGEERYNNKAAVITLTAPGYSTPQVTSFEASLPRPQASPYYELDDAETGHETDSSMESQEDSDAAAPRSAVANSSHAEVAAAQAAHPRQQRIQVPASGPPGQHIGVDASVQTSSKGHQANAPGSPGPQAGRRVRTRHGGN